MRLALLILMATSAFAQRPYHSVTIPDLAAGKVKHTHVMTDGSVVYVHPETDGDLHFRLTSNTSSIVCECIPMLRCPFMPRVGDHLRVWGIQREDYEHLWREIHPIERMERLR